MFFLLFFFLCHICANTLFRVCGHQIVQFRKAHCMVKVNNATQSVDNALCEDAGLSLPEVVEKCGGVECSHWTTGEWTPCLTSRCLSRHRAAQIREVNCHSVNGSASEACDESERPIARQECENERCKPVWRVENWSEVNFFFIDSFKPNIFFFGRKRTFSLFIVTYPSDSPLPLLSIARFLQFITPN